MKTLTTGIPLGHSVNTVVNGYSVMNMPNATVISKENIPMIYLDGDIVPNGYASPGNPIKILEIFKDKLLVLVPINATNTEWVIGYFNINSLPDLIEINFNTINWFNTSNKNIFDTDLNLIYSLPSNQKVQFLYEATSNDYMCILFNDSTGSLRTGFVAKSEGDFLRYSYIPKISLITNTSNIQNSEVNYPLSLNAIHTANLNLNSTKIYKNNISANLVDFVKLKEGFYPHAYTDLTGHLTIGYGHVILAGDHLNVSSVLTQEEATNLLINDLSDMWGNVHSLITNNFPKFRFEHQYQIDAIIDIAYNNGPIIASTTLSHSIFRASTINDFVGLLFDFVEWSHGEINGEELVIFGLYKRKLEDFILFTTGIYTNFNESNIDELQNLLKYKSIYSSFYY